MTIDLTGLGQAIANALVTAITTLLGPMPRAFEQWVLTSIQLILTSESSNNLLTQNPLEWTSRDSDVATLFQQGAGATVFVAVFVLLIQGYRIMSGKVDMYEALTRTIFLFVVGIAMRWLADGVLVIVDAFSEGVSTSTVNLIGQSLPTGLEMGIILLLGLLFAVLAWIKGAVGVVFIKLLIVLAPYFMTLSALPIFEGLGTWWVEEFTTWVLRPFMVALALRLGLGIAARESGPVELIFVLVSFWLAWTMDTRIRRFSVGAWGSIGQLQLLARGAQTVGAALSGGTSAAAASAARSATP